MNKPLTREQAHERGWATLRELAADLTRMTRGRANALQNTAAYLLVDGAGESESERRLLVGVLTSCAAYEAGGRGNYENRLAESLSKVCLSVGVLA